MKNMTLKKIFFAVFKWCAFSVLIGTHGGLVSTCFAHVLSFVTELRKAEPWLILLLPVGGIATVLLYRIFGMHNFGGTDEIITCLTDKKPVRTIAAPLIFLSTAITHLFGGSAGREGAALQLGGSGAAALCRALHIKENDQAIVIMSGMSAVFAGLFGTPLTATFFVLEFKLGFKAISRAIFPCFATSVIATKIASALAVGAETAKINTVDAFTLATIAKILFLALGLSIVGRLLCVAFHKTGQWMSRLISNDFLRTVLATAAIIALTAIVGDMRYNGSGISMALTAVEGKAEWFDFILKIIFTALTQSAGLKGGEIVPTFCVGATFGCFFGGLLGLDPGFAATLGLVGLFCCTTNSPISAVFLGIEMFGFSALPHFIIICIILWLLSGNNGLFKNRFFKSPIFSRIKAQRAIKAR